jgi:hypothetical protein
VKQTFVAFVSRFLACFTITLDYPFDHIVSETKTERTLRHRTAMTVTSPLFGTGQ